MSDNSDDENILKEFEALDDDQNDVPEADAPTIFIIDQTASDFNNPISDISTFANRFENQKLNLIATKLHNLFSTSESGLKFTKDDLQKIEKGICVFIDEALKLNNQGTNNQEKNNSFENQETSIKSLEADNDRLQKQVSDLRRQIDDITKRAKTAEDGFTNVNQELENLKEDKENLEEINNKKTSEILSLRKELDKTTADLKDKIDSLEDQLRNEKDLTQMNQNQIERYENQLNDSHEELALLKSEKVTWKSKIDNQSAKINKLKQQLNEAKLRIQDLEADNQATEAANNDLKRNLEDSTMRLRDVDSSGIQNLQEANKHYNNLVDRFNVIFEEQNRDKEDLAKTHKRAVELLMEQQDLLSHYEDELEILNRDKSDLEAQSSGDERLIRNLRDKLAKAEEELNNYRSDEESSQLNKIRQMLKPRFGEDTDVAQTVQGLLNGSTDNEMKQMNQSLFQVIDNILTFWTKIINEGNVKNVLKTTATSLSSISRSSSPKQAYKEDESVKNDLLVQIARYRQMASQNSAFEASQFPSTDSIQKLLNRLQQSDSEFDQQVYYIISSGAMVAEVLRNLYDRANASYKSVISDLQPAIEVLNFDTQQHEIKDLPKHVIEKLTNYRAFKDRVIKIVDPEDINPDNFEDFLKFLYRYITNSTAILNSVDSDLRQLVDDKNHHETEFEEEEEGNNENSLDLQGVVDRAVEMITDFLNQENNNNNNNNDNSNINTETRERDISAQLFDEDRNKMQNQIDQLKNEAESTLQATRNLEKENNDLKNKVEELTKENNEERLKNQDLTEKMDKLSASQEILEQSNEDLRAENKSLREAMDNKSRLFDKRVNQLMDSERKQHKEDLNNAKERAAKREEKLQQELAEKTNKVKTLKSQLKSYLNQYEQAFKKQKETTAVLKKQNEELNAKLSKISENTTSQKESDRLRAEVKTLETEKLLLSAKLKQAQENVEKIQAMRDNYWMAQMTVRESELNKSITDVTQQAADHFDNFFDQVVTTLEQYLPLQSRVDEDTVIETLSKVVQRLDTAENAVLNHKENENNNNTMTNLTNSPSATNYEERNVSLQSNNNNSEVNSKALVALREWDRWARDLFVNFTDGEVPCQSCKELRFVLGEMILTSISNRKVIFRMESLRAQKKFLLRYFDGKEEVPEFKHYDEPVVSMRPVMILVLAQFHIMKKYGYSPININNMGLQNNNDRSGQQSRKSTPKSTKTTPKKKSFF
ncbi:hypothetical protein M9Y10_037960 [Tritrichomonas musculus]|uniref:Viral A-type inclusion protein n=1 Tax=Tritrichomonas musculus TaxID=1915356 RepID=A0ABR2K822_9EUKA